MSEVGTKKADEIDELLAGYTDTYKESEQPNSEDTDTGTDTTGNWHEESTAPQGSTENWRGNKDYFQTGEKAGQLKKNRSHKAPPDPKKEMEISGTLIDGALFIMLIDLLFPLLITTLNNKVSKDKIELSDIQLTEKQKKDLTPISDEVVKYLTLKANPVWLMVIAMSGIYGINFMAAKSAVK